MTAASAFVWLLSVAVLLVGLVLLVPAGTRAAARKVLLASVGMWILSMGMCTVGVQLDPSVTRHAATAGSPARASSTSSNEERGRSDDGTLGDGMHIVGSDIAPGTYRTRRPARGCYWARLGGFSGELGDVLANGNESGPAIVTIGSGDKGFQSRRCGRWSSDLSAVTSSPTAPFSDGAFLVGVDISAGTWRASEAGCYWARLRGFSGALDDVITNGHGDAVVTIAPSDRGFTSRRCGTWTRLN